MLNDFDAVNRILMEMAELNIVEPIDDPSIQTDFYDYAEVVGIDIDDFVPPEYDHAQCNCFRCGLCWFVLYYYNREGLIMSYEYDDFEEDDTVGEFENDSFDDSMDGDAESALASAGWGTDEDYGCYGEDLDYQEDFHADEAVGFVDYNEDGPYED